MTTPRRRTRMDMLVWIAGMLIDRSTCDRNRVGAVLAMDGRVLSTGYNGAPAGLAHCNHTCWCSPGSFDGHDLSVVRPIGGVHRPQCPMEPCTRAVHAEANAVAWAARHGIATNGSMMVVTMAPCVPCAQLIINAGVSKLVFGKEYRDMSGVALLKEAGLSVWTMDSPQAR